jgi:hypothetical protein
MISPQVLGVFLEYGTSVAIPSCWEQTHPVFWKLLLNRKGGNLDIFFKCIGSAIGGNDTTLQFSNNVTEWAKKTVDMSMAMDIGGKKLFSVMTGDDSQYDLDLVDLFKLIFRETAIPTLLATLLQEHIPKTTSKQANGGHQPNAGLHTTGEAHESSGHRPHMGSSSTTMGVTNGSPQRDQTSPSQSSQSSPISASGERPCVPSEATPTTVSGFIEEEAVDNARDGEGEGDAFLHSWKDVEDTFSVEAKLGQYQSLQLLKTRLPTLNAELYKFMEFLSDQYDLLLEERDTLKRQLETAKNRKRRIDDEPESSSESKRGKTKILGKENINSPLQAQQLFLQGAGTQQRSSDSNGETRKITPLTVAVPRRKGLVRNMSTPVSKGTEDGRNPSGSSSEVASNNTRKRSPNPIVLQLLTQSIGDNNIENRVI